MTDASVVLFEMLGTIAFAVSGAMVGIQKKMDVFGVAILGMVTATGGGILRDVLLDVVPPTMLRDPLYALTAATCSILVFLPVVRKEFSMHGRMFDLLLKVFDSVGLGIFTVMGVQATLRAFPDANLFHAVFIGTLTGVGGGILRDVLAGDIPYVFVKHFYACATIIGAIACALLWRVLGQVPAMLLGAAITIVLRLLAAHYHWNLPKPE